MRHVVLSARFAVLGAMMVPFAVSAMDWYVAPTGISASPGTLTQPIDLATALLGKVGQPGDTFWLGGGDYVIGHIDTKIQGAPGQPVTFRRMPGERVRIDGSITFYQSSGNVVLRDFELYSSDTNRLSLQTGMGFGPTDIKIIPGIASYAPNMSFLNLVVHDQTRHGFYLSQMSSSNLVYGCVVFNNGWASPDNAEGHGIYVQGTTGTREISDNLVFNNSGVGMHIYENGSNLRLAGVVLGGNVVFNAGAIQNVRNYRDWLVGVDAPALSADRIVLRDNMGYASSATAGHNQVQVGRDGINGSVALLNNYMPQGLIMNNWMIAAVAGNLFAAETADYVVRLNQTQIPLASAWNGNSYAVLADGNGFLENSIALGSTDWRNTTGFDLNSTYSVGRLTGTKVFLRPNRFEPGRANIVVYNWDKQTNVAVDISSVLIPGAAYEVRNAEDYFAAPVASGIFDGKPLNLPMTGLTVAAPTAPLLTAPATGPTFNVFVLLPRLVGLQAIMTATGQAQVSWPTNAGNWALQFTSNLSDGTAWVDLTNGPVLAGDRYLMSAPLSDHSRFYRLRATP